MGADIFIFPQSVKLTGTNAVFFCQPILCDTFVFHRRPKAIKNDHVIHHLTSYIISLQAHHYVDNRPYSGYIIRRD